MKLSKLFICAICALVVFSSGCSTPSWLRDNAGDFVTTRVSYGTDNAKKFVAYNNPDEAIAAKYPEKHYEVREYRGDEGIFSLIFSKHLQWTKVVEGFENFLSKGKPAKEEKPAAETRTPLSQYSNRVVLITGTRNKVTFQEYEVMGPQGPKRFLKLEKGLVYGGFATEKAPEAPKDPEVSMGRVEAKAPFKWSRTETRGDSHFPSNEYIQPSYMGNKVAYYAVIKAEEKDGYRGVELEILSENARDSKYVYTYVPGILFEGAVRPLSNPATRNWWRGKIVLGEKIDVAKKTVVVRIDDPALFEAGKVKELWPVDKFVDLAKKQAAGR